MAQMEARIAQIEARLAAIDPPVQNPPLKPTPDLSKESFESALQRATIPAMPPVAPLGVQVPPTGIAPVTFPMPEASSVGMPIGSIPLDARQAAARDRLLPFIQEAAQKTGLSEALITAVIQTESDFDPKCVSSAGAMGLMQLMPENVRELGVSDPFDPRQNILAGAKHLKDQFVRFGTTEKALAAFNAGPGAVERYGGIPPYRETQNYVKKITATLRSVNALPEH
jgi:soluble lytic murein transglycosylase-like protein